MNVKRRDTTWSIFEGKVVVTGGYTVNNLKISGSVWLSKNKLNVLPDMVDCRLNHSLVTIGNKLFVVGGNGRTCSEV